MFGRLLGKLTAVYAALTSVVRQRRERKITAAFEIERRERKALVEALAKKLAEARAECARTHETEVAIVLSIREIQFIEWNLNAWTRHLKAREIYSNSSDS